MTLLIDPAFKPEWRENVPEEVYHADKTAVNSSSLRKILKSPASFKASFWGEKQEPTDAMKFGTLVHQAILEGPKFRERYVVAPEFMGFTKDGRPSAQSAEAKRKKAEWYAEQEMMQRLVVTQEEMDKLMGMIDSVVNHKDAFSLLKNCVTEVSGYFACPKTGILNRIRVDALERNLNALIDVKTTTDCSIEAFSKTIWNYRYDFQMAQYGIGTEIISGKKMEFHAFIAIEKEPPYEVAVYVADEGLMSKGAEDYHKAMAKLAECIKTDKWEGYQASGIQNIGLPHWALQQL